MILFPNAKINIGLYITEKRADGFHNIESCFYPTQWCDVLEIIPAPKSKFLSFGIEIDCPPEKNICFKAYQILQEDYNLEPVQINLIKNIPIGAGLGGGSADASYVLMALNDLFELKLDQETLKNYAGRLGSDCPFFIENQPALVYGTGDQIFTYPVNLSGYQILIVNPGIHVNTAWAFQNIQVKPPDVPIKQAISKPIEEWKNLIQNDFELPLFIKYEVLKSIKEKLYHAGAIFSLMSGSGSSLFGIFKNEIDVSLLKLEFQKENYSCFNFNCS